MTKSILCTICAVKTASPELLCYNNNIQTAIHELIFAPVLSLFLSILHQTSLLQQRLPLTAVKHCKLIISHLTSNFLIFTIYKAPSCKTKRVTFLQTFYWLAHVLREWHPPHALKDHQLKEGGESGRVRCSDMNIMMIFDQKKVLDRPLFIYQRPTASNLFSLNNTTSAEINCSFNKLQDKHFQTGRTCKCQV